MNPKHVLQNQMYSCLSWDNLELHISVCVCVCV